MTVIDGRTGQVIVPPDECWDLLASANPPPAVPSTPRIVWKHRWLRSSGEQTSATTQPGSATITSRARSSSARRLVEASMSRSIGAMVCPPGLAP